MRALTSFGYNVQDRINPDSSGLQYAGRWQGKGNIAFTPVHNAPLTFHLNYGRGINSIDARGVVQRPDQPRIATTDFYQFGTSSNFGRLGISTDVFLIDHSNEQVYIPMTRRSAGSGSGKARSGQRSGAAARAAAGARQGAGRGACSFEFKRSQSGLRV